MTAPRIRNRVKELRQVRASELLANAKNWRTHPEPQQRALRALLEEVGIADALIAREGSDGLVLIDGHLRRDVAPDSLWPVLVLDVNEEEADKLLALLDPLAALAEADEARRSALLAEIETESQALADLVAELAGDSDEVVEMRPLDVKPPPAMSWVLVGIPTVRFGDIAALVEQLARVEGVVCETTSNDG